MRIALLGPSWPLRGGIAATTTALAAALEQRGELAAFLTPRRQYPRLLYHGPSDTDPDACPRLAAARRCYSVLQPLSWGRAVAVLRESAPEAVAVPVWTWVWSPFLLYVARARVAPLLAVVHNPADHDATPMARAALRAVIERSAGALCHASPVAEVLRLAAPDRPVAMHPLPPVAAPSAEPVAARRSLGVPDDRLAILYLGLIRPYKGVDVLLDAVASLPAGSRVLLLLAGEPWRGERARIAQRLARPDLAGRVLARLGWLPEREVPLWLAAADAAVLPYRSATGSAVAAQALGAGLPVVASRVGGLADVVADGVNGLLVPAGDPAALAVALARLTDPALRARLADGARASAQRWTWPSYAAALSTLAGDALAQAQRSRG